MFKEMKIRFKVTKDTAYDRGSWAHDRSDFIFEVKRFRSGATSYGDHSGHTVEIVNHPETFKHHFDTRYAGISREKETWISYWKSWIQDEYELAVDPYDYEENLIEDKAE